MKIDESPASGSDAEAIAAFTREVAGLAASTLRPRTPPAIIGASKNQPAPVLRAAISAGLTHFGENRLQEAQGKWPALQAEYAGIHLHFIGALQSNKAGAVVALFDAIHTVDRIKTADSVADAMARQGRTLQLFIQVNTGEEPQKNGVAPRDLETLLRHYRDHGLPGLVGLMAVPPAQANPAPHFALLQQLAHDHALPCLSMGMSQDYATAIRFGATHLRIGTRIFGVRH